MLKFIGIISLIVIAFIIYDIYNSNEINIKIIINGKEIFKYNKDKK